MKVDLDSIVRALLDDLRRVSDPERRDFVKGYAPTAEDVLGVSVPEMRRAMKKARTPVRSETVAVRFDLARRIIRLGFLESRQAAYELLAKDAGQLSRRQIETLGKGIDNWATVDAFATIISGPAWNAGRLTDADIDRWSRSDDPWWRRAALVSTVALNTPSCGGTGDVRRTMRMCRRLASDQNRFVQKAISWALRSLIRWDETVVLGFIEEKADVLPASVRREVSSKLRTGRKVSRKSPARERNGTGRANQSR